MGLLDALELAEEHPLLQHLQHQRLHLLPHLPTLLLLRRVQAAQPATCPTFDNKPVSNSTLQQQALARGFWRTAEQ